MTSQEKRFSFPVGDMSEAKARSPPSSSKVFRITSTTPSSLFNQSSRLELNRLQKDPPFCCSCTHQQSPDLPPQNHKHNGPVHHLPDTHEPRPLPRRSLRSPEPAITRPLLASARQFLCLSRGQRYRRQHKREGRGGEGVWD